MITVFGSLNMDLVIQVPRLPVPGETVLAPGYVLKPGGKGNNQAIAAARAGADVMMVGAVGRDVFGDTLLETLEREHVAAAGVRRVDENTGVATICVDPQGRNFITVAAGANSEARADWVPEASLHVAPTTVLLQMEVPLEQNWALIRHAHESGALSLLNLAPAAPIPRGVLDLLDVLIVNEVEARPVADMLGFPADDPAALAARVAEAASLTCVVTLGGEGAVAARPDGLWRIGPLPVNAVDTTGAGDAFTGVLAASLDQDYELGAAMHRAAVAGGLACQELGAQESLPSNADIEAALAKLAPPERLR
jgi:ribokinase